MNHLVQIAYLVATGLFVFSLHWLSDPKTARRGVFAGVAAMLIAVLATWARPDVVHHGWIIVFIALAVIPGVWLSLIPLTAVPQRTAVSHAFGGLAAGLVGTAEYFQWFSHEPHMLTGYRMLAVVAEIILGYLTFTGSLMAAGKLQEWLPQRPIVFKGQNIVNFAVLGAAIAMVVVLVFDPGQTVVIPPIIVLSLAFGVFLIIPIGGADMPTVIALLNSYAGLSASMMGFVLDNKLLIIAGALDGASGLFLSIIMCRAMNRSFTNVLFGGFGAEQAVGRVEDRPVRSVSPEEAAMILDAARLVIVVPGYGMAAAQAQHKVRELSDVLMKRGVDVSFASHPVAGRMPGHMNVLLAEADVPYDQLYDLDQINPEFPQADVVLVLGANDVVNPAARHDTASPIYGMPILDADKAQSVIVVKRSMRSGFAGVDNELFYLDKTQMLFGDAKQVVGEVVDELSRMPAKEVALR